MSRRERRRESAKRYQCSRSGQLKHAARSACWRERRRARRQCGAGRDINKVTHQGCPDAGGDASLLACDTPSACESPVEAESANDTALASAGTLALAVLVCRRCAQPLRPHVRQGFLRPNRVGWRGGRDHSC